MAIRAALIMVFAGCAFLSGCIQQKPVRNEDVRKAIQVGMSRAEVEAYLDLVDANYTYTNRTDVEQENAVPPYEWISDRSVGLIGGRINDVRTLYYILTSEHIEFRVETGSQNLVTAVSVYNTYTGP